MTGTIPDGPTTCTTRTAGLLLAVVLAVQLASYLPRLSDTFQFNRFNRDDTESYVALGRSLAQGRGYTRSLDPDHHVPHKLFPPGVPLMVAGAAVVSDSLMGPQLLMVGLALANTMLFWRLARRYLPDTVAITAVFLLACSPIYDRLATVVMTEQPTIFCLLVSILAMLRWTDGGCHLDRWAIIAACALGYGLLVKGLLLPLIPAAWVVALLDRRHVTPRRTRLTCTTLLLALAMIPWGAWQLRCMTVEAPGYDGWTQIHDTLSGGQRDGSILSAGEFANVLWTNVTWFVPTRILDAFAGVGWFLNEHAGLSLPAWLAAVILVAATAALLWALWQSSRYRLIGLVLLLTPLMVLIRPSGGSPRFWLAMHPLILIVLMGAGRAAWRRWFGSTRWVGSMSTAGLTALCAAAMLILVVDNVRREPQQGKVWDAFVRICQEAGHATEPDAVIVSHNVVAARLISNRPRTPAGGLDAIPDPATMVSPIYCIVPSADAAAITHRTVPVEAMPGRLHPVAANAYYTLYRVESLKAPIRQ